MLQNESYLLSQSITTHSASINLLGCRWDWCRGTFLDQTELVNHVIHEHVRTAVPIRRRDIAAAWRMEGEVLKGQSQVTPSFASFSSPSPAPLGINTIPPSPSFNSLVSRSATRKMPETLSCGAELSQSTSSSFASQASVAMKLTQTMSLEEEQSEGEISQNDSEASDSSPPDDSTSGSDSEIGSSNSRHQFLLHRHGSKKLIYSHHADSMQATSRMAKGNLSAALFKHTPKSLMDTARTTENEASFFTGNTQPQVTDVEMLCSSQKLKSLSKEENDLPSKISPALLTPDLQPAERMDGPVNLQAALLSQTMDDPLETQHPLDDGIHSMSFGEISYPPLQTQAPYDSQK